MIDRQIVSWIIDGMWIVWAIVWIVMAFGNKRSAYKQSWISRFGYLLVAVGFSFLLAYFFNWRYRLYPFTIATQIAGIAICGAGIALAIWSRLILGPNWSAIITLKENHELIRSGPYEYIRHPIYSGIILGILGSMVALDPWVNGLLIVIFVIVMMKIKSLQEEKLLIASFPVEYPKYKKEVKSLIPFVL
jgi:protein-S-isoprenylcysteine O-methyltransferase Ste14